MIDCVAVIELVRDAIYLVRSMIYIITIIILLEFLDGTPPSLP
jgi:hypothetical protein